MSNIISKEIVQNHQLVSVTIDYEEVKLAFDNSLREEAKKATVNGFRPGKVPIEIIKKMKGAILLTQAIFHKAEQEITNYIQEGKMQIVGQPLMTQVPEIVLPAAESYTFDFEVGLRPTFDLPDLSSESIKKYDVTVDGDALKQEILLMQRKFGSLDEIEEVRSIEDVLHLDFIAEEDKDKSEVKPVQDVLLVKYFKDEVAKSLVGKKLGDQWTVQLNEAFEDRELEWIIKDLKLNDEATSKQRKYQLTITKIGHIVLAETNAEFFEKVLPGSGITELSAFEEQLKKQFQSELDAKSADYIKQELYLLWTKKTDINLPVDFLQKWYEQREQEEQKKEDFTPEKFSTFQDQLRWSLILNKIADTNKLQITKEDIMDQMKQDINAYYGQYDQAQQNEALSQLLQNEDYIYKTQQRLLSDKVFDWATKQVTLEPTTVDLKTFQEKLEAQAKKL